MYFNYALNPYEYADAIAIVNKRWYVSIIESGFIITQILKDISSFFM